MKTKLIIFGFAYLLLAANTTQAQMQLASGVRLQQSALSHLNATNGLKINAGARFEIEGYVTVADELVNQGGVGALEVKSTSFSQGSLIQPSTEVAATVQRFLPQTFYHYIASPVTSQTIIPEFVALEEGVPAFSTDFYSWDELTNYWINIKKADGSLNENFETNFAPTKGYIVAYSASDYTRNFSGNLNAGQQTATLTKTAGKGEGWNLIGNPFPASLAANAAVDATSNILSQNAAVIDEVYHGIYLWDEAFGYEGNRNDYKVINHLSAASWLAPGQAFMVKAKSDNQSFVFEPSAQDHHHATFYKQPEMLADQSVVVAVDGPEGDHNEVLIAFGEGFSDGLDMGYDAGKLKGNQHLSLYTKLAADNGFDYASQALPQLTDTAIVTLGLDAWLTGNYTISLQTSKGLEGGIAVLLEDKSTGYVTNLRQSAYDFDIAAGATYPDRFALHFYGMPTAMNEHANNAGISISYNNRQLQINNPLGVSGAFYLQLFNLNGQLIISKNIRINTNTIVQIPFEITPGIYVAQLQNQQLSINQKIIIQ
jgi:hypothetical protein